MKRKISSPSTSLDEEARCHEQGAAKTKKLLPASISESAQNSTAFSSAPPAFQASSSFVRDDSFGSSSAGTANTSHPPSDESSANGFVTTPRVNDVLIGKGCETFHHVGNRRFRILVEMHFHNYFKENISSCHRDGIVQAVMDSVRGNHPPGRFLVPQEASFEDFGAHRDADETTRQPNVKWKIATEAEAEAKVHATFLAAGRFLVTKATVMQGRQEEKEEATVTQREEKRETSTESSPDVNLVNRIPPYHDKSNSRAASDETGSSAPISARQIHDQQTCPSAAKTVKCPSNIRDFINRPLSQYFVMEPPDTHEMPSLPPSYIVPSNYDILCGQNSKDYFHHIGNRRFRILIEMSVKRYETLLLHPTDDSRDSIQTLVGETLLSVSKCDPPGRFLGMDFSTGRWRILNPIFAQLKTEQTFFECVRVTQRKMEQFATMEQQDDVVGREEEAKNLLATTTAAASMASLQNTLSLLYAMPCHSFRLSAMNPIDLSALQNQALFLQGNVVGHVEASAVSPSLADQVTLQNVSADECLSNLRHGFYPRELHKPKTEGEKARAESADMMDVVGGMLQLGQLDRRSSV
ncbi:hypothetical protein HJC23_008216 [Cyclotella cryptica]|uniref:DUF6824 domain-containing protein n=1 Tax=Cyclotella cryptica TaxID=29204 RepID=A0ABD3NMR9_9STRA